MSNQKAQVTEGQVEAVAEIGLSTGLSNLRDTLAAAEAKPEAPFGGNKIPAAEYRPRNAIPMKEVVMAKLAGLDNESITSRKVLDQKKDELIDKKHQVESLMSDIGRLGREIHDLEVMIFLDEISSRSLARDHVSE